MKSPISISSCRRPLPSNLQKTTVAEVLKTILAKGKLQYEVEPDRIRLHRIGDPRAESRLP